jgi:hypothetical protein
LYLDIHVSTPKELDGDVVRTISGREYLLIEPDGNKEDIFKEIRDTIERSGYEVH